MTYETITSGNLVLSKPIDRRLIIDVNKEKIDDEDLNL